MVTRGEANPEARTDSETLEEGKQEEAETETAGEGEVNQVDTMDSEVQTAATVTEEGWGEEMVASAIAGVNWEAVETAVETAAETVGAMSVDESAASKEADSAAEAVTQVDWTVETVETRAETVSILATPSKQPRCAHLPFGILWPRT